MDPQVLKAAIHWYVRLNGGEADEAGFQQWLQAHPSHGVAWSRLLRMGRRWSAMPADLAVPALSAQGERRRAFIRHAAVATGVVALGWQASHLLPWRSWQAAYRTGVGEQTALTLPDGGLLRLNTQSAADVQYRDDERAICLHRGELMLQTAPDPHQPARPLIVYTPQGHVEALGTRFQVRVEDEHTHVTVFEHAVLLSPGAGMASRLDAGQHAAFSRQVTQPATRHAVGAGAWAQGALVVMDEPLPRFLAELSRYHSGRLDWSDDLDGLSVSGVFQLHDTRAVLDNLASTLSLRLRHRTRYWTLVSRS